MAICLARSTTAPIERVKLLLQTQHVNPDITRTHQYYKGMLNCAKRIHAEQGFVSFFRGNFANVLRFYPQTSIALLCKQKLNDVFVSKLDRKKHKFRFIMGSLLAGGSAGVAAGVFVYPLDFVRTRLATDVAATFSSRKHTGILNCWSSIIKSDGVRGLYNGFGVSAAGLFVYRAALFAGFDILQSVLFKDPSQTSLPVKWMIAQSVHMAAVSVSYPFDTVRRRMMLQSGQPKHLRTYRNSLHCWASITRNEGLKAFYHGMYISLYACLNTTSFAILTFVYCRRGFDEFISRLF